MDSAVICRQGDLKRIGSSIKGLRPPLAISNTFLCSPRIRSKAHRASQELWTPSKIRSVTRAKFRWIRWNNEAYADTCSVQLLNGRYCLSFGACSVFKKSFKLISWSFFSECCVPYVTPNFQYFLHFHLHPTILHIMMISPFPLLWTRQIQAHSIFSFVQSSQLWVCK